MAITMSQVNACDVKVMLDDTDGALRDMSGSSNRVNMDLSNALGQMHVFGSRFPVRQECKSDASINFRAVYSQADEESMNTLLHWYYTARGIKSLRIYVPQDEVGADQYDFEVFLESLSIPLEGDSPDPIAVEAVFKPTGTFTWAVKGS